MSFHSKQKSLGKVSRFTDQSSCHSVQSEQNSTHILNRSVEKDDGRVKENGKNSKNKKVDRAYTKNLQKDWLLG